MIELLNIFLLSIYNDKQIQFIWSVAVIGDDPAKFSTSLIWFCCLVV